MSEVPLCWVHLDSARELSVSNTNRVYIDAVQAKDYEAGLSVCNPPSATSLHAVAP